MANANEINEEELINRFVVVASIDGKKWYCLVRKKEYVTPEGIDYFSPVYVEDHVSKFPATENADAAVEAFQKREGNQFKFFEVLDHVDACVKVTGNQVCIIMIGEKDQSITFLKQDNTFGAAGDDVQKFNTEDDANVVIESLKKKLGSDKVLVSSPYDDIVDEN